MTAPDWHDVPARQRRIIDLCFRLKVDFIWRGISELLVSQPGVERLLEALTSEGLSVLGLEGFNIDSEGLHPRLDLIYDADRAPTDWSVTAVAALWPPDVWIEIVLDGRDDADVETGSAPNGDHQTR
jgi:hypothetical protein